ncbi:MAG: heavy metal-binding domain-containing protein [Deltaproteobacteria bacterium]|nr:heavy metal-binding domain-containing protein [Deltaproteobacteria bacterium]
MENLIGFLLQVGSFVALLLIGWLVGSAQERRHLRELNVGEVRLRHLPAITLKRLPASFGEATGGELLSGSVVISIDYFKRIVAGLIGIVGGRIDAYESLMQRARREAILRLKQEAQAAGYDAVINVRLETSRLASSRSDGKGTAGIEVLAFGTGVRTR